MAITARYLIDTSASSRISATAVRATLSPLIQTGTVATCAILDAEALYSAATSAEYERVRTNRHDAYEYLPTNDEHWQMALEAQRQLARADHHRAVGIADLSLPHLLRSTG